MDITVTVSQINRRLALLVQSDKQIRNVRVKGEISNFLHHYRSGHMYFTLREGDAGIKAVMFRNFAEALDFEPEDGMNVTVAASVRLYERDGACQLYVSDMTRGEGAGEGLLSFEQLKRKLEAEGLFSQKRPLPPNPSSVCVVTSDTGAAVKDIINVLSRRCPAVKVKLVPVLVQGEAAPDSIAKGIETAQTSGCDLIIFGRGGGSAEDLSAFNAEEVVRAVYASRIPTISAVGHEIDFTLADFAADMRAPTPSAAAELAVPDMRAVISAVKALVRRIGEKAEAKISAGEIKLNDLSRLIKYKSPSLRLENGQRSLDRYRADMKRSFSALISRKEDRLESVRKLLLAVNPEKTLERGYSIVFKDGSAAYSVNMLKAGDNITVKMNDGEFYAVISQVVKNEEET